MLSRTFIRHLGRRLLSYLITIFAALTINFFIPRLIPGDPISTLLLRMAQQGQVVSGGPELVEAFKRRFGLEGNWLVQYRNYVLRLFEGDLGPSIMAFPMTVQDLIIKALPWTIGLLFVSVMISWILGNILGAFIGWRRESKADTVITSLSLCLHQIPYYFLALILVFLLAYTIPLFPASGALTTGARLGGLRLMADIIYHSILPALSIVIVSVGGWVITMRSMILTTLGEDYILLAEAKGLRKNLILMKYALRNALLPQATGLGIALGFIMNGALLTEVIFNYPGLGALFVTALGNVDYNLMQGILLMTIVAVLTANLILEIAYPLIDPRIGHGGD
jgi:peptide/nickel transport system permease protein